MSIEIRATISSQPALQKRNVTITSKVINFDTYSFCVKCDGMKDFNNQYTGIFYKNYVHGLDKKTSMHINILKLLDMSDYKDFLKYITNTIIDNPDYLHVEENLQTKQLQLTINENDHSFIIYLNGKLNY